MPRWTLGAQSILQDEIALTLIAATSIVWVAVLASIIAPYQINHDITDAVMTRRCDIGLEPDG